MTTGDFRWSEPVDDRLALLHAQEVMCGKIVQLGRFSSWIATGVSHTQVERAHRWMGSK